MLLPFFSSSFCNKAVLVQGRMAFSGQTHVNPSGRTNVSFQHGFLWDCACGAVWVIWYLSIIH